MLLPDCTTAALGIEQLEAIAAGVADWPLQRSCLGREVGILPGLRSAARGLNEGCFYSV